MSVEGPTVHGVLYVQQSAEFELSIRRLESVEADSPLLNSLRIACGLHILVVSEYAEANDADTYPRHINFTVSQPCSSSSKGVNSLRDVDGRTTLTAKHNIVCS